MRPFSLLPLALAMSLFSATIANAANEPVQSNEPRTANAAVTVEYVNPENFRDVGDRYRGGPQARAYLEELNRYLVRRAAPLLAQGEQLRVSVTDVDMAGEFEWWRRSAGEVRVVRDLYPPRIDLSFTLSGPGGATIKSGARQLRDPAFQFGAVPGNTDPLRYEKALIDSWLRREFATAQR